MSLSSIVTCRIKEIGMLPYQPYGSILTRKVHRGLGINYGEGGLKMGKPWVPKERVKHFLPPPPHTPTPLKGEGSFKLMW